MGLFEGKTPAERNKIIAAAVLGIVALVALYLAFGRSFFGGSSTTATGKGTPTPTPRSSPGAPRNDIALPSAQDQQFVYETTPVMYQPGNAYAPDAGRNIFAFYEPPPPCDPTKPNDCPPTPIPTPPPPKPPSPVPTPPIILAFANPQSVYAGSRGFRLELNGDHIPPDARILFNQTEMPTTYVNGQRAFTDVPANLIAQETQAQVMMRTPDGKLYSNPVFVSIAAPPKPGYQYIGMIGRKRYNNDTAYLIETGKTAPFGARLNDILGGRFRLVDISPAEVIFEDTQLGFRHPIAISKAPIGTATGGTAGRPTDGGMQPFDPTTMKGIPGIPDNLPRYVPPQPPGGRPIEKLKQDVDDSVDDGKP